MRTVELIEPRRLQMGERKVPTPGPGEVRIAVSTVGICGTDLEFFRGARSVGYPFILGHECAGRVDAIGDGVDGSALGTPVTVRPNFGCGTCRWCGAERDNICPNGRGLGVTIDGCLAEFILAPARYVWPIPERMDLETAALIEPAAVAVRAVRRAGKVAGRRVLVLGAGSIGLLTVRAAVLAGADVVVADLLPERRRLGIAWGAASAVDPMSELPAEQPFACVIETAGVPAAVTRAIECVEPGGRVVLTGIPMDPAAVGTRWIVWRELEVFGSFIYEREDFERACQRIERTDIRALDLVTHRFPLERAQEAFDVAAAREGMKVLITFDEEDD